MKQLNNFLFVFVFANAFSQDIIVDKSKTYSSSNQYVKFDRYTKHGGHGNYDYGSQVGAGMYFYQLRTDDFVKTKKMILLK